VGWRTGNPRRATVQHHFAQQTGSQCHWRLKSSRRWKLRSQETRQTSSDEYEHLAQARYDETDVVPGPNESVTFCTINNGARAIRDCTVEICDAGRGSALAWKGDATLNERIPLGRCDGAELIRVCSCVPYPARGSVLSWRLVK
jgi:hypothetical protein